MLEKEHWSVLHTIWTPRSASSSLALTSGSSCCLVMHCFHSCLQGHSAHTPTVPAVHWPVTEVGGYQLAKLGCLLGGLLVIPWQHMLPDGQRSSQFTPRSTRVSLRLPNLLLGPEKPARWLPLGSHPYMSIYVVTAGCLLHTKWMTGGSTQKFCWLGGRFVLPAVILCCPDWDCVPTKQGTR